MVDWCIGEYVYLYTEVINKYVIADAKIRLTQRIIDDDYRKKNVNITHPEKVKCVDSMENILGAKLLPSFSLESEKTVIKRPYDKK